MRSRRKRRGDGIRRVGGRRPTRSSAAAIADATKQGKAPDRTRDRGPRHRRNADWTCGAPGKRRNPLSEPATPLFTWPAGPTPESESWKETSMTYASAHNGAGKFGGRNEEEIVRILA